MNLTTSRPYQPRDRVIHAALGHGTISEISPLPWFGDIWKVKVRFDRFKGLDLDLTTAEIGPAPRLTPFTVITGASCLPQPRGGVTPSIAAPAPGRADPPSRPGIYSPDGAA